MKNSLKTCSSCDCETPCNTPQPNFPQKTDHRSSDRKTSKKYGRDSKCDGCDCESPCETVYTKNNQ